ncbi:MAG: ribonuclease HII [Syntrophomonadaceae bacterium]|nr:ribonuclease HII [Syntrophomonadaceae bacterium]
MAQIDETIKQEKQRIMQMHLFEQEAYQRGFKAVAGIDEVGRGPIAGPVVAGAVILPRNFFLAGVNDSKKLSASKREFLAREIKQQALSWAVTYIFCPRLDEINIYQATIEAMKLAVANLNPQPDFLLIDAMKLSDINIKQQSIIKGDTLSMSIACASIIAKVERDNLMQSLDEIYPGYGFAQHKGYATRGHIEALITNGPCSLHRVSFEPVKSMVSGGNYGEQPSLFK